MGSFPYFVQLENGGPHFHSGAIDQILDMNFKSLWFGKVTTNKREHGYK